MVSSSLFRPYPSFLLLLVVVLASLSKVAVAASSSSNNNDDDVIQVKAPVVTESLYDESMPLLFASVLAYDVGDIVKAARKYDVILSVPDDFPIGLTMFVETDTDFSSLNNGNGLSIDDILALIEVNTDNLQQLYEGDNELDTQFLVKVLEDIKNYHTRQEERTNGELYLVTYRSIQAKISCVYGIVKDTFSKKIIITFRGSQNPDFSTRDWRTNLDANLVPMKTPGLIRDALTGSDKDRILVHDGFHDYLFDNDRIAGQQMYDRIIEDIKPLLTMEEAPYGVYVTGHSLGAALSQLFSFQVAGERRNADWMPKPITCISFAAPRQGASGYRAAVEQEEKMGLIRMLRINNEDDIVPTLPPWSLGWRKRLMKHVGINLRLGADGYSIMHTSSVGFSNAFSNSIFKFGNLLKYHSMLLHDKRMEMNYNDFSSIMIDDLYKNTTIVSEKFLDDRKNDGGEL